MNKERGKYEKLKKKYKFLSDNTRTHQYKIDADVKEVEEIVEGLVKIDRQQMEEFHNSEEERYWRCSRKIIGKEFKQKVLQGDNNLNFGLNPDSGNQAVFYYSNHCHGCKKFGPFYEELVRKQVIESASFARGTRETPSDLHSITFNRINNSKNDPEGVKQFAYTPVFAFFKKGYKHRPIIMNPIYVTTAILNDFFTVSRDVKVIPDSTVNDIYSEKGLNFVMNFNSAFSNTV